MSALVISTDLERQLRFAHEHLQVANARFSQLLSLLEALQVEHLDTVALAQIGEIMCAREMDSIDEFNKSTQALLEACP